MSNTTGYHMDEQLFKCKPHSGMLVTIYQIAEISESTFGEFFIEISEIFNSTLKIVVQKQMKKKQKVFSKETR